eukprot:CAMPEP_0183338148 /NCGR_PEP_ID=MMETSP0164_2-20130417/5545_1 /TAXON_ID=221442 /ORGANISM="Coccolithus pelagicus ssp braarudi, Strain PLY182g" /LENGTH=316 /DNA_ID=CAMNT_0025507953 /DNA_START=21 /DNA_END=972 /DNA_ORIENTATION=-
MARLLVLVGAAAAVCSAVRISTTRTPPPAALSRRAAISAAAALTLSPVLDAHADVKGANQGMPKSEREISTFLTGQGLPPLPSVPSGLQPLVQYIGAEKPANIDGMKVKDRAFSNTLLVRFFYPSGWLVETPTITENGEAGKIAANNYQKGDSADFVALRVPEGKQLEDLGKEWFKGLLSTQMTNDVYEDVKVRKLKQTVEPDGTTLVRIDYTYTLLTRAGFTIPRKGVASAMLVGDSVVGLVLATTEQRFKELETNFRACADSFRAYSVKKPAFNSSESTWHEPEGYELWASVHSAALGAASHALIVTGVISASA